MKKRRLDRLWLVIVRRFLLQLPLMSLGIPIAPFFEERVAALIHVLEMAALRLKRFFVLGTGNLQEQRSVSNVIKVVFL